MSKITEFFVHNMALTMMAVAISGLVYLPATLPGCGAYDSTKVESLKDPRVDLLAAEYMLVAANKTVVALIEQGQLTDIATMLAVQNDLLRAHQALLAAREATVKGQIDGKSATEWVQLAVSIINGVMAGLRDPVARVSYYYTLH